MGQQKRSKRTTWISIKIGFENKSVPYFSSSSSLGNQSVQNKIDSAQGTPSRIMIPDPTLMNPTRKKSENKLKIQYLEAPKRTPIPLLLFLFGSTGGGCEYLSRCKLHIVLGQVWRSHKMQLTFSGCFNFLNIYTTTNANDILCWMLHLTQHIQLQNTYEINEDSTWNNYKMNATTKRLAQLHFFVQNDPWLAICTVAQVLLFM